MTLCPMSDGEIKALMERIGQLYGQMLWGMALGISLGSFVGVLLNNSEKKKRDVFRHQRHSNV